MSNVTTTTNLYQANRQWAVRPADERFWTLEEAHAFSKGYADISDEPAIDFGAERVIETEGGNLALTIGGKQATMTHWGFGQLARLASAPADYLRTLAPAIAAQCLEYGLDRHFDGRDDMTCKGLVHANGSVILRSLTSQKYTRFWNHQVFERLVGLKEHGWRVPPARPAGKGDPRARKATKADVLDVQNGGFGLSVKVGDLIAPAGIYASDHDMFAFMVNEQYRIDDGSNGGLSRGFFIQNSEVGASGLKVTMFQYRHVCGNHIVWDASNVVDINVRHVGDVEGRFTIEMAKALDAYANSSAKEDEARIKRAKLTVLGKTKEEVLDAVFKIIIGKRKTGLPSGMNQKMLTDALAIAEQHADIDGDPFSVWGFTNGLTRLSQSTPFADDRNFLDRAASNLLVLAA